MIRAVLCLWPFLLAAQTPDAGEIMRRVAANQERAEAARTAYVYDMNVFVRLKRANGKPAREESRDYVVAPGETGAKRELVKVEGKVFEGRNTVPYTEAAFRTKDADIDGALTDSFARDVMWHKGDFGPMLDWFPLTDGRRAKYAFTLNGEERYRDYDVYKIGFEEHGDDACWKGEALIEKNEFQPVLITSEFACKVPVAVKLLLGISVSHIGAKIAYQRFDKDIWFPVTCGGEMKLRLLFMYARTIGFVAKNTGFRKADVRSTVEFDRAAPEQFR